MTPAQELRAAAAAAAAASWAGISAMGNRDRSILATARVLEEYIRTGKGPDTEARSRVVRDGLWP
jgi:hypothetical protein